MWPFHIAVQYTMQTGHQVSGNPAGIRDALVPSVAVRQLDSLKKSERGAREAIRWLERELSRGTDWLRAQKPEESLPLERPVEGLDRSQLQLLECLSFFISSHNYSPRDVQ